jgi:polysaccharide biosynthesis protein PslH
MNVVIVSESMPYPPTAGNRIRTLNLMLKLARRHRLTYIARADRESPVAREAVAYLAERGIRTIIADDEAPRRTGAGLYWRLAANLASRLPYAVSSHNSRSVRKAILRQAICEKVDVWQFEWMAYADALRGVSGVRRVIVAHNIESLIWERYVQSETNPLRRWYVRQQWRKFRRVERRLFNEVECVVTVSPEDQQLARKEFGVTHTAVVDNGVDCAYFGEMPRRPERASVLLLGSLDWRPNLDAVTLLLDRIFPLVRQEEPEAHLAIVGRRPPPWLVSRVAGMRGVELHADVPDVRPYLARATAMTVPLRIGGGSRLKILEAMAAGTPVVSSRVGAEGLSVTAEEHLKVADSVAGHAAMLVQAIRQPGQMEHLAENARVLVRQRYDWESLSRRLEEVWEDLGRYRLNTNVPPMRPTTNRPPGLEPAVPSIVPQPPQG